MQNQKTKSKEIKEVIVFYNDLDEGEFLFRCPHCEAIRGIENETGSINDLVGEQYQDNLCDGWFFVSEEPNFIKNFDNL